MNIVLVIDQFDASNNGTTVTAQRFAKHLIAHGNNVTILTAGEPGENKICVQEHKIPVFQRLVESQGMHFAKPDNYSYMKAFKDADVVHFYMPFRFCRYGEKIAREMGIPAVSAFHVQPENITSSIFLERNKFANDFLYRFFYELFYKNFSNIHCPSEFIANQLAAHGYGARLWVFSNGVEDTFVPKQVSRPAEWDDKFIIVMAGRYSTEKRQDLIIDAAKVSRYADKIQLVFAGKGPKAEKYKRLARSLKNEPIFGFYSQSGLIDLFNQCDLYVHASDFEIEGISCMEAMSCGLVPVISDSDLSATGQFAIDDRSLFKAGDAYALAQKIDYWIEHPDEKAEMSKLYVEKQEQNRVDACVKKAEEMYRAAIDDHQKIKKL